MHALLRHLEAAGFDGAPRVRGDVAQMDAEADWLAAARRDALAAAPSPHPAG